MAESSNPPQLTPNLWPKKISFFRKLTNLPMASADLHNTEMEQSKILRVEVIRREIIKPLSPSPSPDHYGSFKLSLLDQFTAPIYIPILLFYKNNNHSLTGSGGGGCGGGSEEVLQISHRLKSSLSETLTRFYPFAGRLKDPHTITCNDEGVDYLEVQVLNCSLLDVLKKPNPKQLGLLTVEDQSLDPTTRALLLIQVSFFERGGMALGVKFNHKVADAATVGSFVTGWADSALGNVDIHPATPDFSASTLFPPIDSLPPSPQNPPNLNNNLPIVRTSRFVFGSSELAALQAKATSTDNPRPSRFEAVTAFIISKIALLSEKISITEWEKSPTLLWSVNLRSKLQLPDKCFGNLVGHAVHEVGVDETNISRLAHYLRRGTIDICDDFIRLVKGKEKQGDSDSVVRNFELHLHKRNLEWYLVTSWCKLPLYEADFGWGKPLWVTNGCSHPTPHLVVLVDTRERNGIEAMVSLTEEEMARFESDQELKNYASFNPCAFS